MENCKRCLEPFNGPIKTLPCGHIIHQACYNAVAGESACPIDSFCNGWSIIHEGETEEAALERFERNLNELLNERYLVSKPRYVTKTEIETRVAQIYVLPEKVDGRTPFAIKDGKRHTYELDANYRLHYYVEDQETWSMRFKYAPKTIKIAGAALLINGSLTVDCEGVVGFNNVHGMPFVDLDKGICSDRSIYACYEPGDHAWSAYVNDIEAMLLAKKRAEREAEKVAWEEKRAKRMKGIEAAIDVLKFRAEFRQAGLERLLRPLKFIVLYAPLASPRYDYKLGMLARDCRLWLSNQLIILEVSNQSFSLPVTNATQWTLSGPNREILSIEGDEGWKVFDLRGNLLDIVPQTIQLNRAYKRVPGGHLTFVDHRIGVRNGINAKTLWYED